MPIDISFFFFFLNIHYVQTQRWGTGYLQAGPKWQPKEDEEKEEEEGEEGESKEKGILKGKCYLLPRETCQLSPAILEIDMSQQGNKQDKFSRTASNRILWCSQLVRMKWPHNLWEKDEPVIINVLGTCQLIFVCRYCDYRWLLFLYIYISCGKCFFLALNEKTRQVSFLKRRLVCNEIFFSSYKV